MNKFLQPFIAFDQFINCFFWDALDGFGFADETLSARAWRLQKLNVRWKYFRHFIDTIFFFDTDHCYKSFIAELDRHHFPRKYSELAEKTDTPMLPDEGV